MGFWKKIVIFSMYIGMGLTIYYVTKLSQVYDTLSLPGKIFCMITQLFLYGG